MQVAESRRHGYVDTSGRAVDGACSKGLEVRKLWRGQSPTETAVHRAHHGREDSRRSIRHPESKNSKAHLAHPERR